VGFGWINVIVVSYSGLLDKQDSMLMATARQQQQQQHGVRLPNSSGLDHKKKRYTTALLHGHCME